MIIVTVFSRLFIVLTCVTPLLLLQELLLTIVLTDVVDMELKLEPPLTVGGLVASALLLLSWLVSVFSTSSFTDPESEVTLAGLSARSRFFLKTLAVSLSS